jgi:nucleotidyltransferase substrate binding protein (TIGR01987 family)
MKQDIRWIQRFNNFQKAFKNLTEAIDTGKNRNLSKLEEQGLIKAFELVHELAWLTIKEYYENQGEVSIQGSRDAFRLAFKRGLISDGEIFMQSIKTRQLSVHTYNEDTADQIRREIVELYYPAFTGLLHTFSGLVKNEE